MCITTTSTTSYSSTTSTTTPTSTTTTTSSSSMCYSNWIDIVSYIGHLIPSRHRVQR